MNCVFCEWGARYFIRFISHFAGSQMCLVQFFGCHSVGLLKNFLDSLRQAE